MKDKDLVKLLKKNGWQLDRINGSHHIFRKAGVSISVPMHGKDIPAGLLHRILKDAGLILTSDNICHIVSDCDAR